MKDLLKRIAFAVAGLIWLGMASTRTSAQTNPGFETGDFTGWTVSGPTVHTNVSSNLFGVSAHSGTYYAYFGNYAPPIEPETQISQTIATSANAMYDIQFWLQNPMGSTNHFKVTFDGQTLLDQTNMAPFTSWTLYDYTVQASGSSALLTFEGNNPPGAIYLDDVSITGAESIAPEASSLALFSGPVVLGGFCFLRRRLRR